MRSAKVHMTFVVVFPDAKPGEGRQAAMPVGSPEDAQALVDGAWSAARRLGAVELNGPEVQFTLVGARTRRRKGAAS